MIRLDHYDPSIAWIDKTPETESEAFGQAVEMLYAIREGKAFRPIHYSEKLKQFHEIQVKSLPASAKRTKEE